VIQSPPLIPSKFGLNTNKSSGALPVRTVEVDSDEALGSHGYEESVRLACRAAKAEEQRMLEEIFVVRMRGRSATKMAVAAKSSKDGKRNDSRHNNDEQIPA
jgi:hypothetical protein